MPYITSLSAVWFGKLGGRECFKPQAALILDNSENLKIC